MSSRKLTEAEKEKLTAKEIGKDGIAIIVNKANTIENVSKDLLKNILCSNIKAWDKVEQ